MVMERRTLVWAFGLLVVTGCLHPVADQIDHAICDLGSMPVDAVPVAAVNAKATPSGELESALRTAAAQPKAGAIVPVGASAPPKAAESELPTSRPFPRRLDVPPELPGAGGPRVTLPPTTAPRKERDAAIDKLFPNLPPLGPDPELVPGPDGHPLTLADLQKLALTNSPVIRQEVSDVEAAKGAVIQSGAYPNPSIGWAQDEVGTAVNGPAELGVALSQTFVLGGKLTLARAMAQVDLHNAELDLKRAKAEVAGQVRAGYFAVLIAQENLKASRAMSRFTEEIYRVQVDQVKATQAAAYEPRQMRVFALQARNNLIAARNRYTAAWKQLTATLGLTGMPHTQLAGDVSLTVPVYHYEAVLDRVLKSHTDVQTARNAELKARFSLQKARVTPVPDVTLNMHMNKYYTENNYVHSLDITFPVPIFDQNRGGIMQAQGGLVRAIEESHRVRADLTSRVAEAFERYNSNRLILDEYRDGILTDQVEAYLGAYTRNQQEPDKVGFGDVVAAQQALASTITSYLTSLGAFWQAVADMSTLLQTEDLFQATETEKWPALPKVEALPQLPCCHPCGTNPVIRDAADDRWPAARAPVSTSRADKTIPQKNDPTKDPK